MIKSNRFKKMLFICLFVCVFIYSFIINIIGDARGYYKALGISFVIFYALYIRNIKKPLSRIHSLVKYSVVSSAIITCIACVFPEINGGLNSILPNHFLAHIIIIFVGYALWNYNKECFEALLRIIGVVIFISVLFGLFIWIRSYSDLSFSFWGYSIYGPTRRFNAVYLNPIPAGSVFLVGFWITTIYKTRWLSFLQRIIYAFVIFLTQSRSTWIGLVISIILFVLVKRNYYITKYKKIKLIYKIVGISVIAVLLLAVALVVFLYMPYRFIGMFSGEAYNVRMSYWRYVWALFKQEDLFWNIFGHGYGSSKAMMLNSPAYYEPYAIIDNGLLTVLYENGAICLLALFLVFYRAWLSIKRIDEIGNIKWACGMIVLSLIIPSCFYEIQGWNSPIMLALISMAPFLNDSRSIDE